jgi:hypothetical protein
MMACPSDLEEADLTPMILVPATLILSTLSGLTRAASSNDFLYSGTFLAVGYRGPEEKQSKNGISQIFRIRGERPIT